MVLTDPQLRPELVRPQRGAPGDSFAGAAAASGAGAAGRPPGGPGGSTAPSGAGAATGGCGGGSTQKRSDAEAIRTGISNQMKKAKI